MYPVELKESCRQLFNEGYSPTEIASRLNINERQVYRWNQGLKIQKKQCKHCRKKFTPDRVDQRFCQVNCQQNSYYQRKNKPPIERVCHKCGKTLPVKSNSSKRFCSAKCRYRNHYDKEKGHSP